ncbi:hypothetical protein SDC9_74337 [bioreactor metagenome]|uniref:Uncharacterized protein n=1 Tax=bioreactor metagenome TaxID=1076179 RepID=A0A644YMU4_9ZZZZ
MPKFRQFEAKRIIKQNLPRGIRQMFLGPNNMSYMHEGIINNNSVVVDRDSIGFNDNKITNAIGVKAYCPTHHIGKHNRLIGRNTEPYNRFTSFGCKTDSVFVRQVAAAA